MSHLPSLVVSTVALLGSVSCSDDTALPSTVSLAAAAADAAAADASSLPLPDAGACSALSSADYGRSCAAASDCTSVYVGDPCSSTCHCPNAAINRQDLARYQADVAQAPSRGPNGQCSCPCFGLPACVGGTCQLGSCGGQ